MKLIERVSTWVRNFMHWRSKYGSREVEKFYSLVSKQWKRTRHRQLSLSRYLQS
jgi:hypothetical protein